MRGRHTHTINVESGGGGDFTPVVLHDQLVGARVLVSELKAKDICRASGASARSTAHDIVTMRLHSIAANL